MLCNRDQPASQSFGLLIMSLLYFVGRWPSMHNFSINFIGFVACSCYFSSLYLGELTRFYKLYVNPQSDVLFYGGEAVWFIWFSLWLIYTLSCFLSATIHVVTWLHPEHTHIMCSSEAFLESILYTLCSMQLLLCCPWFGLKKNPVNLQTHTHSLVVMWACMRFHTVPQKEQQAHVLVN